MVGGPCHVPTVSCYVVTMNRCEDCGAPCAKKVCPLHRQARRRRLAAEYNRKNRVEIAAKQKARRDADPTMNKRAMLRWKYDISLEEFEALVTEQGNRCAICDTEFSKTPHVDHDHETGAVRGLLCSPCNTGLGHFRDDVVRLRGAVAYLER